MSKKKAISTVVILLAIGLLAYTLLNRGRQLLGYLSYTLITVMIHKIGLMTTALKVKLSIDNPSNTSANVEALKAEIYYIDKASNARQYLASSNVIALNLPAHGSLTKEFYVDVSNVTLLKLFGSAYMNGSNSVLKSKIAIKVKATIAGQYTEKEIVYEG